MTESQGLRYQQIDVFSGQALRGNPLGLVHGAQVLTDQEMARLAHWTNLSETAFLLPPTHEDADYRVRIWTPHGELPFAGHPTLGSCYGWLSQGIAPKSPDMIVQECGIGLVRVKNQRQRLAFAAPELRRTGPIPPVTLTTITKALGLERSQILAHQIVDNGPGWLGLLVDSAQTVLALKPDAMALAPLKVGVIGAHAAQHDATFEVRAFSAAGGFVEDPVTGSLNAGLASWMIGAGLALESYIVAQGTLLGRDGRIHVEKQGDDIWIAGDCHTTIEGWVRLDGGV